MKIPEPVWDRALSTMIIYVNDESMDFPAPPSLETVLEARRLRGVSGIAVAVDDQVIPRHRWAEWILDEGAHVVIITATQGG